ncbi:MAG: helix-turn-helix domain-containing protein [Oscillospiraceae bacterium]|nr:helix-turn-helix domain-containing protein [Oscillospiraceae bacterium]
MATNKLGERIRQARTDAGLTQEQLARKVKDVSAADISKAERGEKELTQEALKQIAKATGVTQKSLLEAAKGKSSSSGKTSNSGTSVKLTAREKKLVELFRAADTDTKNAALRLLSGEQVGLSGVMNTLLDGAMELIKK